MVKRTDLERLQSLLLEFGVEFNISSQSIFLEEGNYKVVGHSGFHAEFAFDQFGRFKFIHLSDG